MTTLAKSLSVSNSTGLLRRAWSFSPLLTPGRSGQPGPHPAFPCRSAGRSSPHHRRPGLDQAAQVCHLDQHLQRHLYLAAELHPGPRPAGAVGRRSDRFWPAGGDRPDRHAGRARREQPLQRWHAVRCGCLQPDGRLHHRRLDLHPAGCHRPHPPAHARPGLCLGFAPGCAGLLCGHDGSLPDDVTQRGAIAGCP